MKMLQEILAISPAFDQLMYAGPYRFGVILPTEF